MSKDSKRRVELGKMLSNYSTKLAGTAWLDIVVIGDMGRTLLHTYLADATLTYVTSKILESKVSLIRSDVLACGSLTPTPSSERYTSLSSVNNLYYCT